MAVRGTLMIQEDATDLAVGAVQGWKIGFGSATKGTVVAVYVVDDGGTVTTHVTEIPLLGNGQADTDAVAAYLSSFGVVLTDAVKQVIGA